MYNIHTDGEKNHYTSFIIDVFNSGVSNVKPVQVLKQMNNLRELKIYFE